MTGAKKQTVKKRRIRFLSRSRFFVAFLIILQLAFLVLLLWRSARAFNYSSILFHITSIFVCVHIFNKTGKTAYKLIWIFLIMLFPIFGGCLYLIFYIQSNPRPYRVLIRKFSVLCRPFFKMQPDALPLLEREAAYTLSRYLQNHLGYPVYTHTQAEYFASGETYYARLLEELQTARRYIFLEAFIIEEGEMFDAIFSILKEKAAAGLDVRVLYDDLGCFATLPASFQPNLEKTGVKVQVFNPFQPVLSSLQNNRDHRKIISIDGKTAFTGGVNIGDQYINVDKKYGRWKDAAILISGEGAWSLTLIFLRLWNLEAQLRKKKSLDDFESFYPWQETNCPVSSDGFVQPYAESPITKEYAGEKVYIHIINMARSYLYINTPYLIPDDALLYALVLAAASGVDVRIITPHIPDKPLVHLVTRSYYRTLIKAGVRIYEFTGGFNHSKTFVSDDCIATVGTTNLDFRSLCLHYECGVVIYKNSQISRIKDDFLATLPSCKEFTLKDCARNAAFRFLQDLLRILAPLM
jgi:cardiolipin synthase